MLAKSKDTEIYNKKCIKIKNAQSETLILHYQNYLWGCNNFTMDDMNIISNVKISTSKRSLHTIHFDVNSSEPGVSFFHFTNLDSSFDALKIDSLLFLYCILQPGTKQR